MIKMHEKFEDILKINEKKSTKTICEFIRNKIRESKSDGLVIGLSGGLDSTTTAYLCAKSVENDKILGLIMPAKTTHLEDVDDAISIAKKLKIEYEILNIDRLVKSFSLCTHSNNNKLANANLKARTRMVLLYYHANLMRRLVVGTGNRTELLVGYFTKYGDGGADILPIGDLYKTQVRQLASYLQVPKNIIKKVPTAGLWAGQTDEEELGIKYEILDKILCCIMDKKLSEEDVAHYLKIPIREVLRVKKMVDSSKHKRLPPFIPKIK